MSSPSFQILISLESGRTILSLNCMPHGKAHAGYTTLLKRSGAWPEPTTKTAHPIKLPYEPNACPGLISVDGGNARLVAKLCVRTSGAGESGLRCGSKRSKLAFTTA